MKQEINTTIDSPWYVKMISAFSGWLASLFLLGFIGMAFSFVFEQSGVALFVSGVMMGGAFLLLRHSKNDFTEHMGLAISLAGQALFAYALHDLSARAAIFWLPMFLLQIVLITAVSHFSHRVFSSFVATISLTMLLSTIGLFYITHAAMLFLAALCWINEFHYPHHIKKIRAIGYGIVLALIGLKGMALFGHKTLESILFQDQWIQLIEPWIGEVLISAVALYVVWILLSRYGHGLLEQTSLLVLFGTLLLCGVSMEAPGITVGVVILLLGFYGSNRLLMGLGTVSLLFYISSYYYLLDTTLLNKSKTLLLVGLALLGVRWMILFFLAPKEGSNA